MNKIIIFVIILFAAFSRLLPHPPNFTPILSICLFSGIMFNKKKYAYSIPLIFMLISDFVIDYYSLMFWVYLSLVIIITIGYLLKEKISKIKIIYGILMSSMIFYILSNFGVWLGSSFYTQNLSGLLSCYIAGLPFFQNNLLSNIFFSCIIFYSYKIIIKNTKLFKIQHP